MILALPVGEGTSEGLCDVLIDHINTIPDVMWGSLTWDQGSEMHLSCRTHPGNRHEDVSSSRPRSPWERGTNENTNGLIREYLPKGTRITTHQPYHRRHRRRAWVDAPEQPWDGPTPREAYERLLVASTT